MAAKIYTGGNDVVAGREHSYLLYDPDTDNNNDPTDGNGVEIIRAGRPDNHEISNVPENIVIEMFASAVNSVDWLINGSVEDRRLHEVVSGSNADYLWQQMTNFAESMGEQTLYWDDDSNPVFLYDTDLAYIPFDTGIALGQNSNSVVNTILNSVGIDFRAYMPLDEDNHTQYGDANQYPAHMALIDGSGNNFYTAYINNTPDVLNFEWVNFQKRDGNDTISLQWDVLNDEHAKLSIHNENNSTGLTTILFNGLNYADVAIGENLLGEIVVIHDSEAIVVIGDYFDDRSTDAAEGADTTAFEFEDIYYRLGNDNTNNFDASNNNKSVRLEGNGGNDILRGGHSADNLYGGLGKDKVYGGTGQDVFYAAGTSSGLEGDTYYGQDGNLYDLDSENDILDYTSITDFGIGLMLQGYFTISSDGWAYKYTGLMTGTTSIIPQGGNDVIGDDDDRFYGIDEFKLGNQGNFVEVIGDKTFDFKVSSGSSSQDYLSIVKDIDLRGKDISTNYSGFEKIVLTGGVATLTTSGATYISNSAVLDYSASSSALNVTVSDSGFTVTSSSLTDNFTGSERIIGSNYGDTFNFNHSAKDGYPMIWTGTGNDTLNASGSIGAGNATVIYTGGVDVINFQATAVLNTGIQESDVSFSIINKRNSYSDSSTAFYTFDMRVNIAGQGSVTLKNFFMTMTKDPISGKWDYDIYGGLIGGVKLADGQALYADPQMLNAKTDFPTLSFEPAGSNSYYMTGTNGADTLSGAYLMSLDGNDTLNATAVSSTFLKGMGGNDILNGNIGVDGLYGGEGNDQLTGGAGDDKLYGGIGNDKYYFNLGSGHDQIVDYEGTNDILYLGAGLNREDMIFNYVESYLEISFEGNITDLIRIEFQSDYDFAAQIEKIIFSDSSEFNLLANTAPVANNDTLSTDQDQVLYGNVMADNGSGADTDADLDTFKVVAGSFTSIHGGSVTLGENGYFNYTPAEGYFGADSFIYTLIDKRGGTSTGTVSISVAQVIENIDPVAHDDDFTVAYGGTVTGNIFTNNGHGVDSDPDGDTLTTPVILHTTSNGGLFNISSNGNFIYTSTGHVGVDSYTYTVSDGNGGTDTATVSITITAPSGATLGTSGNDTLTGNSSANTIFGLEGVDTISGAGGNDTIYGGAGSDTLNGDAGNDTLYGNVGNDTINGGADVDALYGGDGDDTLNGGTHNDTLYGEDGSDTLNGDDGDDTIYGGNGSDTIYGGNGGDAIYSGLGVDYLYGGYGYDNYYFDVAGAAGGDIIEDNGSSAENDQLHFSNVSSAPTFRLTNGSLDLVVITSHGDLTIKNQFASDGSDRIDYLNWRTGSTGSYTMIQFNIYAYTFQGTNSDDVLTMPSYNLQTAVTQTINGLDGNDTITGATTSDTLNGGAGNDTLNGAGGHDSLTGGDGNDTLNGGIGNDYLYGSDGDDILNGNDGQDYLYDGAGDDIVNGNAGDDEFTGGTGNDMLYGGAGLNKYMYSGAGTANDIIEDNGSNGVNDSITFFNLAASTVPIYKLGNGNTDLIIESSHGLLTIKNQFVSDSSDRIEQFSWQVGSGSWTTVNFIYSGFTFSGTSSDDLLVMPSYSLYASATHKIYGYGGNDVIAGGSTVDYLYGGDGTDVLYGGANNDTLYGEAGNDTLIAQAGDDTLYGGSGADTFLFDATTGTSGIDTIADFNLGDNDRIDVSQILQGYDPLTDLITDFVQITTSGANSILKVDVNGGGNSFVQIATISGVTGLTDEVALMNSGNLIA